MAIHWVPNTICHSSLKFSLLSSHKWLVVGKDLWRAVMGSIPLVQASHHLITRISCYHHRNRLYKVRSLCSIIRPCRVERQNGEDRYLACKGRGSKGLTMSSARPSRVFLSPFKWALSMWIPSSTATLSLTKLASQVNHTKRHNLPLCFSNR